jgi:hypothetical protein
MVPTPMDLDKRNVIWKISAVKFTIKYVLKYMHLRRLYGCPADDGQLGCVCIVAEVEDGG